ncbi:MAG: transposase [Patescibacteria group bacterium]
MSYHKNNYSISRKLYGILEDLLPEATTRPFKISNLKVLNYVLKRVRVGCQFSNMGKHQKAIFARIKSWREKGVITIILKELHKYFKLFEDQELILIVDTQSVKNSKTAIIGGYDANKKVFGVKRCPLVGIDGDLFDVFVYPANVTEKSCLELTLRSIQKDGILDKKKLYIFADKGYFGKEYISKLEKEYKVVLKVLEIDYHDQKMMNKNTKEKNKNLSAFAKKVYEEESKLINQRNVAISTVRKVVEHFFAWLGDYRLLAVNYEKYIESQKTDIQLAGILMLSRRYCKTK